MIMVLMTKAVISRERKESAKVARRIQRERIREREIKIREPSGITLLNKFYAGEWNIMIMLQNICTRISL